MSGEDYYKNKKNAEYKEYFTDEKIPFYKAHIKEKISEYKIEFK